MDENVENYAYIRCLFCEAGHEGYVAETIKRRGYGLALLPAKVKQLFRKGAWIEERQRMMPGYVFVFAHEAYESIKLRQIDHVIRVLHYKEDPEGYLMGRDRELAELFLKKDGVLGTLAAVEIDGRVQITDGLLKNYQGKVIKMDKRKQMAEIQLDIAGDVTSVWLSYEILEGQTET